MTFVFYRGEVMATFGMTRYYLSPALDHLDRHDPLVRFVAAMIAFGLAVRQGRLPGPYTTERAELFARLLMMEEWDFGSPSHAASTIKRSRAGSAFRSSRWP